MKSVKLHLSCFKLKIYLFAIVSQFHHICFEIISVVLIRQFVYMECAGDTYEVFANNTNLAFLSFL